MIRRWLQAIYFRLGLLVMSIAYALRADPERIKAGHERRQKEERVTALEPDVVIELTRDARFLAVLRHAMTCVECFISNELPFDEWGLCPHGEALRTGFHDAVRARSLVELNEIDRKWSS